MIKFIALAVSALTLAAQDGPHGWPASLKISSEVFIGKPLAYWKGALIRPSDDEHPGAAVPLIFNGAGEQKNASLTIPDADRVVVRDSAVSDSRVVAFCGDAAMRSGEAAGFVALSESDGRMLWIIQTNPYHPLLITFGPNNTIWVIGQNVEDGHATLVDQFVFRIISMDGRLVSSHTSRSALGNLGALHLGPLATLGNVGAGCVVRSSRAVPCEGQALDRIWPGWHIARKLDAAFANLPEQRSNHRDTDADRAPDPGQPSLGILFWTRAGSRLLRAIAIG